MRTAIAVCFSLFAAAVAGAQQGHYEGLIKAPDREISIAIDLDKTDKGWVGSLDVLAPEAPKGLLMDNVAVDGDQVTWVLAAFGKSKFTTKYDAQAKTLNGSAATPGGDIPVELKRTGEAKVKLPPPSTPITKDIEGKWEGAVDFGKQLRLIVTFAQGPDGKGAGDVISLDQGSVSIPLTTVTQDGSKVTWEVRSVGGSFTGALNDAKTEIGGDFTQAGRTVPLVLKRQAAQQK